MSLGVRVSLAPFKSSQHPNVLIPPSTSSPQKRVLPGCVVEKTDATKTTPTLQGRETPGLRRAGALGIAKSRRRAPLRLFGVRGLFAQQVHRFVEQPGHHDSFAGGVSLSQYCPLLALGSLYPSLVLESYIPLVVFHWPGISLSLPRAAILFPRYVRLS